MSSRVYPRVGELGILEAVAGPLTRLPATTESSPSVGEDEAARLGALFDAHHERLYRLARRMTGGADEARDLVQETFLRAARRPGAVPIGMPHEEAWLVRVLVNLCRDRWRSQAVRDRAHAEQRIARPQPASNPESAIIAQRLVWRALEELPPRRRATIVLYELEGATIPAIARLLGVNPITVRWHLSKGRRELARALGAGSAGSHDR